MSDQERAMTPPELPEEPVVEERLAEELSETAAEVTGRLQDLADELTPPTAESPGEPTPFEAPPALEAAPKPGAGEPLPPLPARKATAEPEGTSDDRLMAALAWFTMVILQLPVVSIIQLLSPTSKERAFQRHHAVTSLLFYAAAIVYESVVGIAYAIVGVVTLGLGLICLWPLFFVPHALGLYYALQAYNGKRVTLPILSDLGRNQGWL